MRTSLRGPLGGAFLQPLERLFQHGTTIGLTEGELLERFVRGNDESAFEVLIARHGPMVLGVCRRMLRDPNDVDDAFQATFLVLVRKAGTLRRSDLLGNWLYGVAHRVATRARIVAARRAARVPFGTEAIEQHEIGDENEDAAAGIEPEPIPWLHEEVRRLPEKYRVAVLLCYFEGLTHEEAASRLGWPIGTVKGRLARARDLLRRRLTRRGISTPAGELSLAGVRFAVPESLKLATLRAARATLGEAGTAIASSSAVSLSTTALADGVLRAMILTHAKSVGMALLLAGALTTGLVLAAGQDPARPIEDGNPPPVTEEPVKARASADRKPARLEGAAGRPDAQAGAESGMMPGMSGGQMSVPRARRAEPALAETSQREFQDRVEITRLASVLAAGENAPKNQAILTKLDQPLTMAFASPTPLVDVLKYIKSATVDPNGRPIPIYIDPRALEQVNATLSSPVTIDLDGIPLKMGLRLMLKQLGLAYCVRDGVLIISSVQGIREELAEAASERLDNDPKNLPGIMQSMGLPHMGMGSGPGMM